MAFITLFPAWHGKRAVTVSAEKAKEIAALLKDMPGDLSEERYDFLKCVSKIYPGLDRDSHTEQLEKISDKLTHEGILQGMNEAIPKGDR